MELRKYLSVRVIVSVKIVANVLKPVLGETKEPSAYGGNTATGSPNRPRRSSRFWACIRVLPLGIPPPPGDPGCG